jgi:pre-mRNA-processing factor 6
MDERGQVNREKRHKKDSEALRKEAPKVQLEFADLTSKLSTLSEEEWMSIPEIGDSHIKKSQRAERYVPVPDSMLAAAHNAQQVQSTEVATPQASGVGSVTQDLTSVGKAQKLQLDTTLARASSSVANQTAVNTTGYMTDLNAHRSANEDMVDLNKARDLLSNVTTTNPSHAPGWIAAARLEHIAGKITTARKIMLRGCAACPKNDDVWLEAARLHSPDNAKIIFARAVQNVPTSVKLWLGAADLEENAENKKRVLRKGIELVPTSVDLWKAAIELEEPDDARVMLEKAVEFVPHSVDMWLALAHMNPYKVARKVLNRARDAIPTDPVIWITAARLEETHDNEKGISLIISKAVANLASRGVTISRQKWLEEAYKVEATGGVKTASAIVRQTVGVGLEDSDRKHLWMADAEAATQLGHYYCARAIYAHALSVFPQKKSIWRKAAELEKAQGSVESLMNVLEQSVKNCPQSELLWLFLAREKWKTQDLVDEARKVLQEAFSHNPESERIWLAAVHLETENGKYKRARILLQRAREKSNTAKVWVKSVKLEALLGEIELERDLLKDAIVAHPKSYKLWLMYAELEGQGKPDVGREIYQRGLKNCPQAVALWISASKLEMGLGQTSRARAILETARFKAPASPELWKQSIKVEREAGNVKLAEGLLSRALQECPTSGVLLGLSIGFGEKKQQRNRIVDALKKADSDPVVLLQVALVFWQDRRLDKAKTWLERAVNLDSKYGDAWGYRYKFALQYGTAEEQEQIVQKCVKANPTKGDKWCEVSKSLEWIRAKKSTAELLRVVTDRLQL